MSLWEAPLNDEGHVCNGVQSAFAIFKDVDKLNIEFTKRGWPDHTVRELGRLRFKEKDMAVSTYEPITFDAQNIGLELRTAVSFFAVALGAYREKTPHSARNRIP